MTTPEISIIIPVFNEEEGLSHLYSRVVEAMRTVTDNFEIVFVDDGSRDRSKSVVKEIAVKDARVKLVSFSRNFGKEKAMTAGIDFSIGKAVILLDADLQDPPELMAEMVKKWKEGYKVVAGKRKSRPGDSWLKAYTARKFYKIINRISTVPIPHNTGDFRLMDRQVVETIKRLGERTRFMKGIFAWAGFPTYYLEYDRPERHAGETKWNYRKLWSFALDGIFSFTTAPLKIWTYLGAFFAGVSFVYASYLILKTMLYGSPVPGYPSLMVAVLFMGGIQLMSLGIIGEYVGRIYRETKQRPLYVVEETVGIKNASDPV